MKALLIILASLLAGAACDSPAGPDGQGNLDYNRLLQGLRQSGLAAEAAGPVSQPFLPHRVG